jgi:predicted transcriptional regulator
MSSARMALVPQLPDLDKIRQMRKRLNLSQRELANLAGVSQSLIAKIERGSIDPSYSNVRKILMAFEDVLRRRKVEGMKSGAQLTVGDLATKGVITVGPDQNIAEATDRMMKGRFTQLPVTVGDKVVGALTDDRIRDYTIEATKNRRGHPDHSKRCDRRHPHKCRFPQPRVEPVRGFDVATHCHVEA